MGLYTCVTLANINLVSKQTVLINSYYATSSLPHGLEFLLAEVAIQFVIQNSKRIISITMSAPAGYRTFYCETNTKAIIIIGSYIYYVEKSKTPKQTEFCILHYFVKIQSFKALTCIQIVLNGLWKHFIWSDQSLFSLHQNRLSLLIITLFLLHTWLILCRHFEKKQTSDYAGASVKTVNGNFLLSKSKITCHMLKTMRVWFTSWRKN